HYIRKPAPGVYGVIPACPLFPEREALGSLVRIWAVVLLSGTAQTSCFTSPQGATLCSSLLPPHNRLTEPH
ncbi:MAG: hypothetical protein KDI10_11130, partial [Halioglobus sp.]|nr:hypothetical protein [Halioglobus sp.]